MSAASPTGSPPRNASCANWVLAWTGNIKRRDSGEGIGEEFESLAVLDRRIAKVRLRIAQFKEVANGNILPRMETW